MSIVVPDSIEPIEAFRCWNLVDGKLVSITNGEVWTPGQPLQAQCRDGMGADRRWIFVRHGSGLNVISRDEAETHVRAKRADEQNYFSFTYGSGSLYPVRGTPSVPRVDPPHGYGFALETVPHDCPNEKCVCGIYAVDSEKQVPGNATVYGKVKLWGKVIPGEKGYRAEFAYPSEFWVPSDMEPNDGLLDFDVPIILKDDFPSGRLATSVSLTFNNPATSGAYNYLGNVGFESTNSGANRVKRVMWGAIALNLACAALNLLTVFHVF